MAIQPGSQWILMCQTLCLVVGLLRIKVIKDIRIVPSSAVHISSLGARLSSLGNPSHVHQPWNEVTSFGIVLISSFGLGSFWKGGCSSHFHIRVLGWVLLVWSMSSLTAPPSLVESSTSLPSTQYTKQVIGLRNQVSWVWAPVLLFTFCFILGKSLFLSGLYTFRWQ